MRRLTFSVFAMLFVLVAIPLLFALGQGSASINFPYLNRAWPTDTPTPTIGPGRMLII